MNYEGQLLPEEAEAYVRSYTLRDETQSLSVGQHGVDDSFLGFAEQVLPAAIRLASEAAALRNHTVATELISNWTNPVDIQLLLTKLDSSRRAENISSDRYTLTRARVRAAFLELGQIGIIDAVSQFQADKKVFAGNQIKDRFSQRVTHSRQIFDAVGAENYPPLLHGYNAVYWPDELVQVESTVELALGNKTDAQASLVTALNSGRRRLTTAYQAARSELLPRIWPQEDVDTDSILSWSQQVGVLTSAGVVEARLGKVEHMRDDVLRGLRLVMEAHRLDPNPSRVRTVRKWALASAFWHGDFTTATSAVRYALRPMDTLNDPQLSPIRN